MFEHKPKYQQNINSLGGNGEMLIKKSCDVDKYVKEEVKLLGEIAEMGREKVKVTEINNAAKC